MDYLDEHTIEIRARYVECDPMGYVHHTVYPEWFERARTEMLRRSGTPYSVIEREGMLIVVAKLEVQFKASAKYDDVVEVTAYLKRSGGARIEHHYVVKRGDEVLCTGQTVLACVDRETLRVVGVPDSLSVKKSKS